jgi:hypothetical protein
MNRTRARAPRTGVARPLWSERAPHAIQFGGDTQCGEAGGFQRAHAREETLLDIVGLELTLVRVTVPISFLDVAF